MAPIKGKPFSIKAMAGNPILVFVTLVISVSLIEIAFRLINFDFDRQEESFKTVPIFFRQPSVPVGETFFRRPGPDAWRGQVLLPGLRVAGGIDDAYRDETEVIVTYDQQGFRNPENLTDWDVVVGGDLFVELGFLPYEDLYTTQLGTLAGVRVKNLGVSFTGPLSYNILLKEYGKSEHTRHAMMVFYEGNDVIDLMREFEALQKYKAVGTRGYRTIAKQTSFVQAAYRKVTEPKSETGKQGKIFQNSFFVSSRGEIPFTISATPPGKSDLSPEQKTALSDALGDWARIAKDCGMTPWLVYMPAKRRVFDGHFRLTAAALRELINRLPSDLPDFVRELSVKNGIRFVDVTPALVEETEMGKLTYNPIWDAHLNRGGSRRVAKVLADAFKEMK